MDEPRRRPLRPPRHALLAVLCLAACGCTGAREWVHNGFKVGPEYCRPPAAVAPQYVAIEDPKVRDEPPEDSRWWTVFNDAALDRLVQLAYRQNLSLREAGCRILQARAQRAIAVGNLFPQQQQAFADYSRNGASATVDNRQFMDSRFYDLWDGGFNLSWELDFWGRFRRAIESADAQLSVAEEDYDAVLVLLVANTAETYARIRTLQEQVRLTEANVILQRKTYELVETQRKLGRANQLDVEQAATSLAQTESLVPPLRVQLRQSINQLCVLLGIPPEKLEDAELLGPGAIPTPPAEVAVGIPADLLRRRPDVRQAEWKLVSRSAEIGVATAQLYPHISIVGTIGVQSSRLADLAEPDSFFGNIGPSLRWDVLNYGRNLSRIRLEDARFQESVASYQNTVLKANQEVENGLVAFLQSQLQVESQARAAKAARKAVDLGWERFQQGIIDFTAVFVLEQTVVQQENQLAQAKGNVAAGLIGVYRALGGGWQVRCPEEAPLPPQPPAEQPPAPLPDRPAAAEEVPPPEPEKHEGSGVRDQGSGIGV